MDRENNSGFSSRVGVIMAAAGSAIGLGNIWKFPYETGENGGGAFLIVYLLCVLLFGMPLLMTEFLIGRKAGKSTFSAFREISGSNRWQWLGWLSSFTVFILLGFYFVVTGWCFNYLYEAIFNSYIGMGTDELLNHFTAITSNPLRMSFCSIIPIFLTAAVLWFGVTQGIERLSKILMPLLIVMMIVMAGRVMMLDGSNIGMRFLFEVDFSKITPQIFMEAAGQCFFSLSIGLGLLITYGAYMPKDQDVSMTSFQVLFLDTLVALLAGVIIFPAVFAFGFNPAEGPQLVFVVLPAVMQHMSFVWFSGVFFFSLLCIAAITSTISLMEVVVAAITEFTHGKMNRHKSVLITAGLMSLLAVIYVLSMTNTWPALRFFDKDLFQIVDDLVTIFLMPLSALCMSLFVGWFMPAKDIDVVPYSKNRFKKWSRPIFVFLLRWFVPIAILLVFLNGLGII